jgi:hypothetical protein
MVRRGSTVRVRQRASTKCLLIGRFGLSAHHGIGLGAGALEGDLEGSVGDRCRLADQLI